MKVESMSINENVWVLSSSGEEDENESLLPKTDIKFHSPANIKTSLLNDIASKQVDQDSTKQDVPPCSYGSKCYRKNPNHFKKFSHQKRKLDGDLEDGVSSKKSRSHFTISDEYNPLEVIESSNPHRFLLTTVSGISSSFNHICKQPTDYEQQLLPNSLSLEDILSEKMGQLTSSAHFNYCFDVDWLMNQYPQSFKNLPLLLVHGDKGQQKKDLQNQCQPFSNITLCQADLPIPYGTHHTKMMLLNYQTGLRVVVTTANLVQGDWSQKTQGIWISPLLPRSSNDSNHDSETRFRSDLLAYLKAYKRKELSSWISLIESHDFSAINVALVASVPGSHDAGPASWGHLKLRKLLKEYAIRTDPSWPVVAQFSSIGSLGKDRDAWLCSELLATFASSKNEVGLRRMPSCKLIFPSVDDVRCSLEGYPAGASLPYSSSTSAKQPWLTALMHRWKAGHCGRTQASPHIKTYFRVSPFETNIRAPWFLLTSANLSKSAWGSLNKAATRLSLRSYELGVLFLPKFVLGGKANHFRLCSYEEDTKSGLPIHIELPMVSYTKEDQPWTWDVAHRDAPDSHGNMWVPS